MKNKRMTTCEMMEWSVIALIITCTMYVCVLSYVAFKNNGLRTTNAIEINTKKK